MIARPPTRAPLAHNFAEVIDDVYRQHAPQRDHKRPFPLHVRRKQLARLVVARHKRLPDDGWTYVKVAAEHCPNGPNRREALMQWLEWVCAAIRTRRKADDILERITPRRWSADALGKLLTVTDFERATLRITTIASYQTPKAVRIKRRKEKQRLAKEARRRANGSKPREQAFSRTKPWEAAGFRCRRTWERHGKPAAASPQLSQIRPQHTYCSYGDELATSSTVCGSSNGHHLGPSPSLGNLQPCQPPETGSAKEGRSTKHRQANLFRAEAASWWPISGEVLRP